MKERHNMLIDSGSNEFDRAGKRDGKALVAEAKAARAASEAARIEKVKARGAVPDVCGTDIPLAPARGPLIPFTPMRLVPGQVGVAEKTGHWEKGEADRRKGARIADVFDRIEAEARRAHKAKGDKAGRFVPPLTPAQVQIGRDYRDMVERRDAGGMKCVSLETGGHVQGGTGGGFIEAFMSEGRQIEAMRRRIGPGAALAIRRIRPSNRGSRTAIADRALVDDICLRDMDPSAVLRRYGWAVKGETREALRRALADALDRMIGYR